MKVILLEKIRKLGELGDQVNVKAGYARNYLIPQAKAVPATKTNVEHFEERRAELEKAASEALAQAQKRSESLEGSTVVLARKTVGEEVKLYGSINIQDIADAMNEQGLEVEKRELVLPGGAIRSIGEYEIEAHLHSEVIAKINVEVKSDA